MLVFSANAPLLVDDNAATHGESRWQLWEGKEYEYEFVDDLESPAEHWSLEGASTTMIQKNLRHPNQGIITTGIYVGTAHFKALNKELNVEIPVDIEIQSAKTRYREDYRKMLADITSYYTDLVMQQGSPVTQKFEVDFDTPQKTLYQKFAYVKSIIEDEQFEESIHKILSNPVRKWTETTVERHIESVKKLSKSSLRQIVTRKDRIPYFGQITELNSVPRYLTVNHKTDSIDTPENQFVKYVLVTFYGFCSSLGTKKHANEQLRYEVDAICNVLAGYLNGLFFKDVSLPSHLNLGSPVLQRKEGYREILQAWLMFDLAAKITWRGGDDVYDAGKKNVAVLYEYWLFFKLKECVTDVFNVPSVENERLIKNDEDGINLEIRQGHTEMIHGSTIAGNRRLNVSLYYNRVFNHTDSIHTAGSWTVKMRPDYTLSIWPGEMSEPEAEKEDAIVHIHFDAKYRLEKIILEDKEVDLDEELKERQEEKENGEIDIYKRGDLLKMHAYKDAIRRTGGAYVLYPGSMPKIQKGFHEIIPGLGAFCIAPGHVDEQMPALKQFLIDVVKHFQDRTSQREKVAIAEHDIHAHVQEPFEEAFPEPYGNSTFPDSVKVLIGCYKSEEHLQWILERGKYNIRFGGVREGSILLEDKFLQAKYLLLYDLNDLEVKYVMKMTGERPSIVADSTLAELNYPDPTPGQLYMVYDVSRDKVEKEIRDIPWWYIENKVSGKNGAPVVITYTNLFHD